MSEYSFPRKEKLKSQKLIEELFQSGRAFSAYPLLLKYIKLDDKLPDGVNVQAGFTAPKRRYKSAVKRNLIKRRMREAYRLHKSPLIEQLDQEQHAYALMLIYTGKEILDYHHIEKSMVKILRKLIAHNTSEKSLR